MPTDSALLMTIIAALHARELLRFDYAATAEDDGPPHRVEPHHLLT
ncbi:hypothetical protein ABZ917_01390 [Nonomuraea wenchangensis]